MTYSILKIPPTLQGFLAILLWSTAATTISSLQALPQFELLTISFFLASFYTLSKVSIKNEWSTLKAPLAAWLLVISGIVLQQFLYISAFSMAPPAEVDILIYLWPTMAVIFSTFIFRERIRLSHILAVALGITAVFLLSCQQLSFECFSGGHLCALLCAVSWSLYTVLSRYWTCINPNMIGASYGLGFVISLVLHAQYEAFVIPTIFECCILLYFGLALTLGAFSLWTNGVQYGYSRTLTLSTYAKPVASLFLLCAFGFAEITPLLLLACICVMFAGVFTSADLLGNLKYWFSTPKLKPPNTHLSKPELS